MMYPINAIGALPVAAKVGRKLVSGNIISTNDT